MRKLKNEELDRLSVEEFKETRKFPIVVMLDNIRSMNNVGSAFRTSDAFLVEKLILTGITAQPPHRDIHKTALGATDSVSWDYYESTIEAVEQLRSEGYKIFAVEQVENSIMLDDFTPDPSEKYCLVFGNEVMGVDQEVIDQADGCLEIPQFGTKHSLNISVSIGVVLWDLLVKIRQ